MNRQTRWNTHLTITNIYQTFSVASWPNLCHWVNVKWVFMMLECQNGLFKNSRTNAFPTKHASWTRQLIMFLAVHEVYSLKFHWNQTKPYTMTVFSLRLPKNCDVFLMVNYAADQRWHLIYVQNKQKYYCFLIFWMSMWVAKMFKIFFLRQLICWGWKTSHLVCLCKIPPFQIMQF